jgi:glycine amidinotransferase
MKADSNSNLVSVYTEWAPLKEVIVGSCVNFNLAGIDRTFRFLYENRDGKHTDRNFPHQIDSRYIAERQEDLDNLQALLEGEGITVKRPSRLREIQHVKTPDFESYTTGCDSPRDMYLCIADQIIETPPTNRKRYFEHALLRTIFMEYFRRGARWVVAPRPSLREASLDFTFWKEATKDPVRDASDIDEVYEIAFDAANCLKFGKDVVMNVGTKNHELGAVWLQRQLGPNFKVHPIRLCDSHIDGHFVPIAPGKLLVNEGAMHGSYDQLPPELKKWDRIPILDKSTNFDYPSDHLQMATNVGMSVNVLSLDEKRILIRDTADLTIKALKRSGFEPIPVRLRHSELFGGGLHCSTVDVRREDSLEDYFS